ncbi:MAG: hypothetical protein Q4B71_04820 [Cardiobacteriaceae bacterium]|nr:hypothetical protein [Cardiobacteriaceae bacterium]
MKTVHLPPSRLSTSWLSWAAVLMLSGCMYGPTAAPVINQNQYLNQPNTTPQYPPASQVLPPAPSTPTYSAPQASVPAAPKVVPKANPTVTNKPTVAANTPPSASDTPKYDTSANQSASPTHVPAPPRISDQPKYTTTPSTPTPPSASDTPKYDNARSSDGWAVSPNVSNTVTRQENNVVPPPVKVSKVSENNPAPVVSDEPKVEPAEPKTQPAPKEEPTQVASNQTPERPQSSGSAVSDLLSKASSALGKGDLNAAASHLEAAQRIDSKNPKILYDIANIRYHQKRYREAETYAGRAANLGGENSMSKKSWQLISNARKALGDNQGAVQAAERAARFN